MKTIGYSLLELLACLAIVSLFATFATTSWHHLMQRQKANAITQSLIRTVNYARTQALVRQQPLLICPLTEGSIHCGNDWSIGWQVTTLQAQRLRYITPPANLRIQWRDLRQTNQIKISPNGDAQGSNGSFYYGQTQLSLNRGGRIRRIQ